MPKPDVRYLDLRVGFASPQQLCVGLFAASGGGDYCLRVLFGSSSFRTSRICLQEHVLYILTNGGLPLTRASLFLLQPSEEPLFTEDDTADPHVQHQTCA